MVPKEQSPVLELACSGGARHHVATQRLTVIGTVQVQLAMANEEIFTSRGRLSAQVQLVRGYRSRAQSCGRRYELLTAHVGRRAMARMSSERKRAVTLAKQEHQASLSQEQTGRAKLVELVRTIQAAEAAKAILQYQNMERNELVAEVDTFHRQLFAPDGRDVQLEPIWIKQEQLARYQFDVLTQIATKLHIEAQREKSMRRDYLDKAQRTATELLTCVRKAIGKTTEIRIGSHIPTSKEILNGHEMELTRTITPILQQAKTLCGRMFTIMAQARVATIAVAPLPEISIVELHKLPTRRKSQHHKGSLHHSLEASFAQATWCINHVAREKERSVLRQKQLAQLSQDHAELATKAQEQLRALRSEIVQHVWSYPRDGQWTESVARSCLDSLPNPQLEVYLNSNLDDGPFSFTTDPETLLKVQNATRRMLSAHMADVRHEVDEQKPPLQGVEVLDAPQFRKEADTAEADFFLDPERAGYEYMPGAAEAFGQSQAAPSRLLLMSGQRGAEDLDRKKKEQSSAPPKEDDNQWQRAVRPKPTLRAPGPDQVAVYSTHQSEAQPASPGLLSVPEDEQDVQRTTTPPPQYSAKAEPRWSPNSAPIRTFHLDPSHQVHDEHDEAITLPIVSRA